MSGAALLACRGIQDEWIVGESHSLFTQVYKKHTHFASVVEKNDVRGQPKAGGLSTIQLRRTGDLVGYTYLTFDAGGEAQSTTDWTTLIESVEFVVGGTVIDRQTSEFMEKSLVDLFAKNVSTASNGPHPGVGVASYFFPLRFWWCENVASAFPMAACSLQEVEIRVRWGANANIVNYNWECFSMYYYLDEAERNFFGTGQTRHQLIYQVQEVNASNDVIQDLTALNHPIKFICSANNASNSPLKQTTNRLKIKVNGVDLFPFRYGKPHFVDCPFYYHTTNVTFPDIFLYPFCQTTSLLQPTGHLNASRVQSLEIVSETLPLTDKIYAVNLNVVTFSNLLAGLRYAN
jgi:hypothetical protein